MTTETTAERKGVWERLFTSWVAFFILVLLVGPFLHDRLGVWWGTAAYLALLAVCVPLLWRARNRQRRKRLGRIAEATGTFEGWLRYPAGLPDSLRRRWAFGTFRLAGDTLDFQPMTGDDGDPLGRPTVFTSLTHLGLRDAPTRERGVPRRWEVVAVGTDRGEIEVRVPPEGVTVLEAVTPRT